MQQQQRQQQQRGRDRGDEGEDQDYPGRMLASSSRRMVDNSAGAVASSSRAVMPPTGTMPSDPVNASSSFRRSASATRTPMPGLGDSSGLATPSRNIPPANVSHLKYFYCHLYSHYSCSLAMIQYLK